MKVVIVEPGKNPYVANIDGSLDVMQDIVEGNIETVPMFGNSDCLIVCNEAGKLLDLEYNRPNGNDYICGTFFVCTAGAEDFEGLTDEQALDVIDYYMGPGWA